jgi:hypothetical protein
MFGGTRATIAARYGGLELTENAYRDALRHLDESTRHLGEASTLLRTSIVDKRTKDDRKQDRRAVAPSPFPLMYPPVVFGLDDEDDDFDFDVDEDFGALVDDQALEKILRNLDEATSLLRTSGTADKRLKDRRQIDQRTTPASTFGPMTIPGYGADDTGYDLSENRRILRASNRFDRAVERGASRILRADDRFDRAVERGASRAARAAQRVVRLQDEADMEYVSDEELDAYLDSIDLDLDDEEEFGGDFMDRIAQIENEVVAIVKKYVSMLRVPTLLSYNKQRDAVIDQGKSSNSAEAVALEKKGLGLLSGITQPMAGKLWTLARQRDNLRRQASGRSPESIGTPPQLV